MNSQPIAALPLHPSSTLPATRAPATFQSCFKHRIIADRNLVAMIKSKVTKLYGFPASMSFFPGTLPVSLMRKDLKRIQHEKYYVAEKTDGTRHLLLCFMHPEHGGMVVLIDRGYCMYYTNLGFSKELFADTLFDGEIIWEPHEWKYYIHDVMYVSGQHVGNQAYSGRMRQITSLLQWNHFPPRTESERMITPLAKPIYNCSQSRYLWNTVMPGLSHKSDGLIFTPEHMPHKGKKNKRMFKWKAPEGNTIDLILGDELPHNPTDEPSPATIDANLNDGLGFPNPVYELLTWDTKRRFHFAQTAMSLARWRALGMEDPRDHKDAIVECEWNGPRNMWVPIVWRKDKLVPNDTHTIRRTLETILEGLSIEEVLRATDDAGRGQSAF